MILDLPGNHRMRSNNDLSLAALNLFENRFLFFCFHATAQENRLVPERAEDFRELLIVLRGKNHGRSHNGTLKPIHCHS